MFFWNSPRPQKQYAVKRCERGEWAKFRRHHYLNGELPNAVVCYGVYDEKNIIAFMAVLHQPHGVNKKIKRVCRLVVLPDYQGVGIATRFLNMIAEHYTKLGFDFSIVTSAKNLIGALRHNTKWVLQRYSTNSCSSAKNAIDYKRASMRSSCKTASFFYRR